MCGILGGNNKKWDFESGIAAMSHRGPDGSRVVRAEEVVLAFTRLAMVDLSENGMQPMFYDTKEVGIVFNGEIYGFKDIRAELEKKYVFKSDTDTEVLLRLYMEYGDEFVNRIDGMFAIAIYDKRVNSIKLYRDRVGIKPLYYYEDGTNFAFSSELKGLKCSAIDVNFQVDYTALYDYLTYSFIPEPKTMYKNIYKMEPACMLQYHLGLKKIIKKKRYWNLHVNGHEHGIRNLNDVKDELRSKIKKSVEKQMVADVPVGVMTSGGVDSSVITYECSCLRPSIQTFTMGVSDSRFDETAYAKLLTDFLGLQNNVAIFNIENLRNLYEKVPEWFGEPFADRGAFITYELMKMASGKVKALLAGDGGDEVFGGYTWQKSLDHRFVRNNSNIVSRKYLSWSQKLCEDANLVQRERLDNLLLDDITWFCKKRGMLLSRDKEQYRKKWKIPIEYDDFWYLRKFYHKDLPPMTRLQVVDFHTYLPYILQKTDAISMAMSIEVRVPLLSKDIIEFSFGLPQNLRCPEKKPKELLKQTYSMLPKKLFYREKVGFTLPREFFGIGKSSTEIMLKQLWRE